jgi:hypothetical protein
VEWEGEVCLKESRGTGGTRITGGVRVGNEDGRTRTALSGEGDEAETGRREGGGGRSRSSAGENLPLRIQKIHAEEIYFVKEWLKDFKP